MKRSLYGKSYFEGLETAQASEFPRNQRVLKLIEKYQARGTLLDVGIGTGLFLYLASKSGWQVWGLDQSKYAAKQVSENMNIKVILGKLERVRLPKSRFDAVNMRHTIEHIKNPQKALVKVFGALKEGGVIAIATPNSFGFHAKVYGQVWPHWSLPYHLHFFSTQSLKSLVESSGYEVLEIGTEELTIFDLIKFLLNRAGLPVNYQKPFFLSIIIDRLLAKLRLGEGIYLIARKPNR